MMMSYEMNLEKVWEYYLKVWKKITRPIKLGKFPNEQFDVTGRMMTEMLLETVQFRSETKRLAIISQHTAIYSLL